MPSDGPRDAADALGFSGLLAAGADPAEAWETIRARCAVPEVRAVLEALERTPDGRAALERSRQAWAAQGFPPPWDDAPEVAP